MSARFFGRKKLDEGLISMSCDFISIFSAVSFLRKDPVLCKILVLLRDRHGDLAQVGFLRKEETFTLLLFVPKPLEQKERAETMLMMSQLRSPSLVHFLPKKLVV